VPGPERALTTTELARHGVPHAATTSSYLHRVAFYETDAMGIVHHANYLRFFEQARVRWLEEHDRPYADYMALGVHFAVTRSEVDYHRSARFDDRLRVTTWLAWVRGASIGLAYLIDCEAERVCTGVTEHAAVRDDGRVVRIPRERRDALRPLAVA
jgi:acyl-CoA thioester hydrolase